MDLKIEYSISVEEFFEVIESVGWKTYSKEQINKALSNTMYMVKVLADGKLAGIGRVVGDYSIVCMLSDICVKPEFQGKEIGLKIVNELKRLIENGVREGEKMLIELTPTAGNEEFYKKAGFKYKPDSITGMYLWVEKPINKTIISERVSYNYIGKTVKVIIDRPIGSIHPDYPDHIYLVNYGYVPNTISGYGEELDCYILGEHKPLKEFTGKCIAVIHRLKEDDDKLVIVPEGKSFSDNEIRLLTEFQEKYFESEIIR